MVIHKKWLLLTAILATLFALSPSFSAAAPEIPLQVRSLLRQMEAESGGTLKVEWNEQTGTPSVLEGRLSPPSNHSPQWIATVFVHKTKALYGLKNPNNAMRVEEVDRSRDGLVRVRLQHLLFDTPVWGGELRINIDGQGVIRRVEGQIYPNLEKRLFHRPMRAAISANKAVANALEALETKGTLSGAPEVRPYYLPTRPGTPLVYVVTVQFREPEPGIRHLFVHGLTGRVIGQVTANISDTHTRSPSRQTAASTENRTSDTART